MCPDVVLKVVPKNAEPPASEWKAWSGDVSCEPGHYHVDDLGSVRVAFHTKGLCPLVQLNNRGIPKGPSTAHERVWPLRLRTGVWGICLILF